MLAFIVIVILILFLVLFRWIWTSLKGFEIRQKLIYILIGTGIVYLVTFIVFQISASSITYPNEEIKSTTRSFLVNMFAPINGFILLPQLGRWVNKLLDGEIDREKINKRILILGIVFIIVIIFECQYFASTQDGIVRLWEQIR